MDTDRQEVAYHEAGHAVVDIALGVPFRYVTIRPTTKDCDGLVLRVPDTQQEDDSDQIVHLAGAFAQARWRWLRKPSRRTSLAALEEELYFAETTSSDYNSMWIPEDGDIDPHWRATHDLIERRWGQVSDVAGELLRRGTLRQVEVRAICGDCDDRGVLAAYGLRSRAQVRVDRLRRMREIGNSPEFRARMERIQQRHGGDPSRFWIDPDRS